MNSFPFRVKKKMSPDRIQSGRILRDGTLCPDFLYFFCVVPNREFFFGD